MGVEREYKFTLPDAVPFAELSRSYLARGWRIAPRGDETVLRSEYFDTEALRLLSLGVGFRFRSQSSGPERAASEQGVWCVKAAPLDPVADERFVSRMEWEHPGVAAHPPAIFYPALAAYVGGEIALQPLAHIVVRRTDHQVFDQEAHVMVSYDEVYLGDLDASPTYREVEIEFGPGAEGLALAMANVTLASGAKESQRNKLEVAVGNREIPGPEIDGVRARLSGDLIMELSFSEDPSAWLAAVRRAYIALDDESATKARPQLAAIMTAEAAKDRRATIELLFQFVELFEHLVVSEGAVLGSDDDHVRRRATEFEGMATYGPAD